MSRVWCDFLISRWTCALILIIEFRSRGRCRAAVGAAVGGCASRCSSRRRRGAGRAAHWAILRQYRRILGIRATPNILCANYSVLLPPPPKQQQQQRQQDRFLLMLCHPQNMRAHYKKVVCLWEKKILIRVLIRLLVMLLLRRLPKVCPVQCRSACMSLGTCANCCCCCSSSSSSSSCCWTGRRHRP